MVESFFHFFKKSLPSWALGKPQYKINFANQLDCHSFSFFFTKIIYQAGLSAKKFEKLSELTVNGRFGRY
jgi:hypothetical protein